ncbi:MAG: FAD-dependent oxidoreductase [Prolixibacteraceae bacterium]|jgi:heterodisulfide reductase subunit A|nr:CoB--CoM heterodisulfide reductase iron-sulfur subunit A family protein [Bacteroidales bacterium]OQB81183.1 MAG: putative glutamate synthase subunit beta [Bacteroidetes bacterium ADurb.Bin123]HNZ68507.1 FAD-dependent oxidoreductase [Prolixibacteraceae bacterium]HOC86073.1 FAD-dependent oxidoreductase [Prolixibacteraceae bacterium]HOY92031.1 FAD-dependent oxidoreductase [Prolixibacteraceae bacterium]
MSVNPKKRVAVVGAGVAGIAAAVALKRAGVDADVYEKESGPGGHLTRWHALFPGRENAATVLQGFLNEVKENRLDIRTGTLVTDIRKENGLFRVTTGSGECSEYGAVLLANGFRLFDAARKEEYGYGIYPRVITSPDLEKRMEDPATGLLIHNQAPKKVAFVHCVGSRDAKVGNRYCSKVCCISGVKQAIAVREQYPSCEVMNFYMDLRMFGSGFEELYQEAQEKYGINFIRGRVSEAAPTLDGSIQVKAEDTLLGCPLKVTVDWLILLVGMEPGIPGSLHDSLGLERDDAGFAGCRNKFLLPGYSSVDGLFLAGACAGPATIPDSVNQGRAAALSAIHYLNGKV